MFRMLFEIGDAGSIGYKYGSATTLQSVWLGVVGLIMWGNNASTGAIATGRLIRGVIPSIVITTSAMLGPGRVILTRMAMLKTYG